MDHIFVMPASLLALSLTMSMILVEVTYRVRLFDLGLYKVLTSLQNIL